MIYFLIRKFHIADSNMKAEYQVEKYTSNLDEANKFLSALYLLYQDEYVSFFISAHQFQEPLILTEEVA